MSEITVASTTDTQEAINQVAGAVPEPTEEAKEGQEQEAVPEKEAKPEPQESKNGFQKRIDKLTREKYQLREQYTALEQRLQKLESGQPAKEEPKKEAKTETEEKPRPKQEDFTSWEAWQEADDDWRISRKLAKMAQENQQAEAKRAQENAAKKQVDDYAAAADEARERYDDWDEVVGRDITIPPHVGQAIIEQKLTDVAYYLGKHPDVCRQLMEMTPVAALTKVGQIAAALEPVETEEPSGEPVPKIKTRAAQPIRPVSGNSTKSSVPIDELPFDQYRKIRDRQEKERYRR